MRNLDPKTLKKILLVLLGVVVLAIIVNLLSSELETILRAQLGDQYLTALLVAGGAILVLYLLLEVSGDHSSKDELEDIQALREELLAGTLKRYKSRRKDKLNHELTFQINIELAYVETRTNDPVHRAFTFRPEEDRITDYQAFFDSFYHGRKRLLILGDPGSGKTLLLLRMGESLIEKAKADPVHPVPIIINLAGWRSDEESFEEWMTGQLVYSAGEAGISSVYAKRLVAEHQILPLLDGFDEIPVDHRASCFEALEGYLKRRQNQIGQTDSNYPEVILCSRRKAFYETEKPAPVYATAMIKPLTPAIVEATLEKLVARNNAAAGALLIDFKKYVTLQEALQTAFFVHTVLSLYAGDWKPDADWYAGKSVGTVQNKMVHAYLSQEFYRLDESTTYSVKKARHWLSWLANRLGASHKGVSFELADMQPEWLGRRRKDKAIYRLIGDPVGGIIAGLFFGLGLAFIFPIYLFDSGFFSKESTIFAIALIPIFVPVIGALIGLGVGLFSGVVDSLFYLLGEKNFTKIKYKDIVSWDFSIKNIKRSVKKGLQQTFDLEKNLGLYLGFYDGFVSWIRSRTFFSGLIIWFVIVFSYGLTYGLFLGLSSGLRKTKRFPQINFPYQRVSSNLVSSIVKGGVLFFVILIIIRIYPWNDELKELTKNYSVLFFAGFGFLIGSFFALIFSNSFKFIVLYSNLFLRGYIPFRFVRFLNQTADQTGLLERDGGQWRFRHDLLQRALTAEWEEHERK